MGMENGRLPGPPDRMAQMLADTVLASANPSTRLLKKAFWEEFGGAPPEGVVTYFSGRLRECELKGTLPMKVLVAMPEIQLQNSLKAIAQKGGFAPICAGNQEDTLNLWTEHEPAMLVADARLAGFGEGIFLETLRRNTGMRPPYIILCTNRYDTAMGPVMEMADDCAIKSLLEKTLALRLSMGKAVLGSLYAGNVANSNGSASANLEKFVRTVAFVASTMGGPAEVAAWLMRHNLLISRMTGGLPPVKSDFPLPQGQALAKAAGQTTALLQQKGIYPLLPQEMTGPLKTLCFLKGDGAD
ncbi:MAG: hypothetical protein QMD09_02990 [Desulfatibacillaceae bacterium]|nr:hypothetical protein [Desulfatibacillaceae bacterium]